AAARLVFPFDPLVTPTTVVAASWDPDGTFHAPFVFNAADFGQMLVSDPNAAVQGGRLLGVRAGGSPGPGGQNTVDGPATARARSAPGDALELAPVYLARPPELSSNALWPLVRRAWWNVLQINSAWTSVSGPLPAGIVSNNVVSDPCSLA